MEGRRQTYGRVQVFEGELLQVCEQALQVLGDQGTENRQ